MQQKPIKRLERKLTVENMWIYILSLLRDRPMYAYEIRGRIKDRFGFDVGQVTAYVVLYKLENSGYVNAEWKDEGRQRKYYSITDSGEILLDNGVEFLENLTDKIRTIR
jgi:PadR family transcriptional regulator PadR